MKIADLHADVLCKLLERPEMTWSGPGAEGAFDTTPERLRQGGVALQVFPIYLPEGVAEEPESLFRATEAFWSEVVSAPGLAPVRSSAELEAALREGKIGAILSLESAAGLRGELWALRLLHRMGLRLLGPTWNHANWACDGAMEPRGGGFTKAGRELVTECENLGILIDVSHLSDRGFWELEERATRPIFASHSNARAIVRNPRNLTDDQIRAIVRADGIVGLTFVPWFATSSEPAGIEDVLRHVEHVCALGGEKHVAFGSDFDGISRHVAGLENPAKYPRLIEELLKRYPESFVKDIAGDNAFRFLANNLPG